MVGVISYICRYELRLSPSRWIYLWRWSYLYVCSGIGDTAALADYIYTKISKD